MKSLLATVCSFPLLAAFAAAQTPNYLVGLTRNTPVVNKRDQTTCTQLPICAPPGFPPAAAQPYAGGTAYDPMRQGTWISNGFLLAEVDDNCNYICPPAPAPLVSPNAVVTGLEEVESLNQVWMLDSFGNIYQMQYACPPAVLNICNTGLGLVGNNATGGLAVDECNRLVFYSYSNWVTGATQIHVATIALPCQTIQVATPTPCAGSTVNRPVTGLACDGCRNILYMTDGFTTIGWNYTVLPGPVVVFGAQNCCTLPSPTPLGGDPMIGLAVRSGGATSLGPPCANGACPLCPMVHSLRNSPNLGNAQFGLDLSSAPFGSLVWCIIGVGPCSAPGALVPPLCGPVFTGPVLGTLGPNATAAGFGCGAFTTFNMPLPVLPGFCGVVLSSQCVAICPSTAGTVIGTSLSNCLSWELQSN
jgi:hypothetical protein